MGFKDWLGIGKAAPPPETPSDKVQQEQKPAAPTAQPEYDPSQTIVRLRDGRYVGYNSPEHIQMEKEGRGVSAPVPEAERKANSPQYAISKLESDRKSSMQSRDFFAGRADDLATFEGYIDLQNRGEVFRAKEPMSQEQMEADWRRALTEAVAVVERADAEIGGYELAIDAIGRAKTADAGDPMRAATDEMRQRLERQAAEVQRLWQLKTQGVDVEVGLKRNQAEMAKIQNAHRSLLEASKPFKI